MKNEYFINQVSEIVAEYNVLKGKASYKDLSDQSEENLSKLISKSKSFVVRAVGLKSEYYKDILFALEQKHLGLGTNLMQIMGSLKALKEDLEKDYLKLHLLYFQTLYLH